MTMKRNIIAAVLLLSAVAYSCTTKEESSKSLINDGSVVYNPTATVEDFILDGAKTKTVLTIDESTGANFTFVEDDVLGVFPYDPEQGDQVRFTVKSSSADACVFNGHGYGLKAGQLYATYYPADLANAAAEMATKIPVDYTGQVQTASDGETFDISAADYLVANGITPENNECHFTMKHVGALVVMDVTFPEGGTFTEISLNAPSDVFVQTGTIDLTQETVVVTPETTANSAKLSLGGEGVVIDPEQTVRFCMMIAPVDLSDAEVKLVAKNDAGEELFATVPSKNFQAGYAYKLACTVGAEAPAEPTNLSAKGTANCYIVDVDNINEAGYYFDCTVAGNGQTVNMNLNGWSPTHANVWPKVNNTYSANLPLLHATDIRVTLNQNNCISNVTIDPTAGIISFKASGEKGNAKILVMDAANDDPAWVWHIWCTDQPATVSFPAAGTDSGGISSWGYAYTVMDRNLGAIRATFDDPTSANNNPDEICGLYYQFGNPTGFTFAEFESALTSEKGWRMVDGIAGVEKRHKPYIDVSGDYYWFNPYGASASDGKNFLYGRLWGGGSSDEGTANHGPSAPKTMYDPCPVGYKLPTKDFSIAASDSGDQYGWYKNGTDGAVYFPYNGGAWGDGGNYWQTRGYVPNGDTARYTMLWTANHQGRNMAWHYEIYSKDVNRAGGGTMAPHIVGRGMGVRCVAE